MGHVQHIYICGQLDAFKSGGRIAVVVAGWGSVGSPAGFGRTGGWYISLAGRAGGRGRPDHVPGGRPLLEQARRARRRRQRRKLCGWRRRPCSPSRNDRRRSAQQIVRKRHFASRMPQCAGLTDLVDTLETPLLRRTLLAQMAADTATTTLERTKEKKDLPVRTKRPALFILLKRHLV